MLIGGGHEQSFGIGQTYSMEEYTPKNHEFSSSGIVQTSRVCASALNMGSDHVVVAGNWYADDMLDLFDGKVFAEGKSLQHSRAVPYILQTVKDNAIILGAVDSRANPFDTILVERLQGNPFTVPLFSLWHPFYMQLQNIPEACFIGDRGKGIYRYLITCQNREGQLAFVQVEGETFSLLPTTEPIPMQDRHGKICYFSYVTVDKNLKRAYVLGTDEHTERLYVVAVDYSETPAPISLFYADGLPLIPQIQLVLMPDGNLLLAGGLNRESASNFNPVDNVLLLYVRPATDKAKGVPFWYIFSALLGVALLTVGGYTYIRKRKSANRVSSEGLVGEENFNLEQAQLVECICQLFETEQLFRQTDLRITDVAEQLGVHRNRISASLKAVRGQSFTQFTNAYRVEYAKKLLQEHPEMKIYSIAMQSGFTTEKNFFVNFKAITGFSPLVWAEQQ